MIGENKPKIKPYDFDEIKLLTKLVHEYGFVTCYKGEPIGFICWDPRNRPEYVEIGHNGIRAKYKGNGFGKVS